MFAFFNSMPVLLKKRVSFISVTIRYTDLIWIIANHASLRLQSKA